MANRQALQDLQKRIAKLLQQASSEGGLAASWLGVRLGGQRILLPLQQSGEIYPLGNIQPLPYAKPWFRGVAALRGQVFGVVDLAAFMPGMEPPGAPAEQPGERGSQRLIAINESFGINAVIRVDALEGLRGREDFVRSDQAAPDKPAFFGSVFHDKAGKAWQEINLQALVQTPGFLDIAADTSAAAPAGSVDVFPI